jgi:hypothetical protein
LGLSLLRFVNGCEQPSGTVLIGETASFADEPDYDLDGLHVTTRQKTSRPEVDILSHAIRDPPAKIAG